MTLDAVQLWYLAWPQATLLIAAFVCLMTSVFGGRKGMPLTAGVALLGFAMSAYGFYTQWQGGVAQTLDLLVFDPYGNFLGMLISIIGFIVTLTSYSYLQSQEEVITEYFCLLLFCASGMTLMVATTHLLTLILALEVMSLSLYVLVGLRRHDKRSSEASFKYFLLGSVATSFLLFGVSLFYGSTGTLDLKVLGSIPIPADFQMIYKCAALLILLGFAFKVAAVPFQFWAPDVYDGAPLPVTGFMSTGVKVAAFGALVRVLQAFCSGQEQLPGAQWVMFLSIGTMVVGNLAALRQQALKRILAYSSISHAGYLMLGMATLIQGHVFHSENLGPILFYFVAYSLLTLGAFAVLTSLSSGGEEFSTLEHLDGLAEKHPVRAAILSLFFISLAGIPPSAGFFAKYYVFSQAIAMGLYPLAIVGILMSAVSLYYYLGPVARMFFRKSDRSWPIPSMGYSYKILLTLMVLGVFYFGIFFSAPVQLAKATKIFLLSDSKIGKIEVVK